MQKRIGIWAVWTLLVCLATLLPGNCYPEIQNFWDWLQWDKLIHLLLFGVFTTLLYRIKDWNRKWTGAAISLLSGFVFGGVTEWMQYHWIPGRSGNFFDFAADVFGCLLCLGLYLLFQKKKGISSPDRQ